MTNLNDTVAGDCALCRKEASGTPSCILTASSRRGSTDRLVPCKVLPTDYGASQTWCDFESGDLCGWTQRDLNDSYTWRPHSGSTPSRVVGTGPLFDHTFGPGQQGELTDVNSEVLRADDGDWVTMERRRSEGAGEAGDPREDLLTNGIVRHDSHLRKTRVTRPGIEPCSPWWEASGLTARPPWPQLGSRTLAADSLTFPNNERNITMVKMSYTRCSCHRLDIDFLLLRILNEFLEELLKSFVRAPVRLPPRRTGFNSRVGSLLDIRMWKSQRTMSLVGGFTRGYSVSPAFSFRRCSILTSITLISSQNLAVESLQNVFTHSLSCDDCQNLVVSTVHVAKKNNSASGLLGSWPLPSYGIRALHHTPSTDNHPSHPPIACPSGGLGISNQSQDNISYPTLVDLCFTAFGVGPLVFVRGSMNTEAYCNILDNEMLPTLWRFYGMDPCYFHDDNARSHVSRATMQWYADNNVCRLDWPAQSPDLNPIEHL
ncbi:hypothetical protein PR048_027821 [Dryococelus australis]|uniref:MAM domain-containing protein n=1 Tax=Dryococelus australis TaxID=614101 RepID=A0ABQ9GHJ2_9NEOP|nr:hypothetical protein PR048_027821 [Dryococelus australis]